jgi:hypothetical protein
MKDVIAVSEITGKTVSEIVSEAVENDIQKFRCPQTGKIAPKKGLWLSNFYEVNSYPEAEQRWEPCLILYRKKMIYHEKMIRRDYVCIFSEGRLFNTPAAAVKPCEAWGERFEMKGGK